METFKIGKKYKHTTGKKLMIVGVAQMYVHGLCLIGEDEFGELSPVGPDVDNFVGWSEIKE